MLQFQFNEMKETLKQSEELLNVSTPHHPLIMSVKRFADFHIKKKKKKKSVLYLYSLSHREAACWGAFHSFSFFSRTVDTCSALLSFFYTFAFLSLLFRRSVSCV